MGEHTCGDYQACSTDADCPSLQFCVASSCQVSASCNLCPAGWILQSDVSLDGMTCADLCMVAEAREMFAETCCEQDSNATTPMQATTKTNVTSTGLRLDLGNFCAAFVCVVALRLLAVENLN